MKKLITILMALCCSALAFSQNVITRFIIDNLIGYNKNNLIVFQTIREENIYLEHNDTFFLLEKNICFGETNIISSMEISDENCINDIITKKYGSSFVYATPDFQYPNSKYTLISDKYIINDFERKIDLYDHIPKELKKCKIIRIVDFYRDNGPFNICIIIDLVNSNRTEYYRKIIQIPIELWEV